MPGLDGRSVMDRPYLERRHQLSELELELELDGPRLRTPLFWTSDDVDPEAARESRAELFQQRRFGHHSFDGVPATGVKPRRTCVSEASL
ncbi:hypothetical protein [Nocardia xishanensis]